MTSLVLVTLPAVLAAPTAPAQSPQAPASAGARPLGCRPSPAAVLQQHLNPATQARLQVLALPSAVDWSAGMPAPGDQLWQGSCVGWATGYALKTYQENAERAWGVDTTAHQFSPGYIYNQINDGVDGGAYMADALDLLVEQGCDTLDSFPYDPDDYLRQPTTAQRARAWPFRARQWSTITYSDWDVPMDIDLVKAALRVEPVVAGGWVYRGTGWDQTGDINRRDVTGWPAGGHAICIVGYDDDRVMGDGNGAFKFINSWGPAWGHAGYGWMSYEYMRWEMFEAEQMWDLTATLALNRDTLDLTVGQRGRLSAALTYSGGSPQDVTRKATWSSSDPAVATVAAGYVTGVAPGEATITASHGFQDVFCAVRVLPPPPRLVRAYTTLEGIHLTWSPPTGVAPDGYIVSIGDAIRGTFTAITDVTTWDGGQPNYDVTAAACAAAGLTFVPGTRYYFQARSYVGELPDDALVSTASTVAGAVAGPQPPPPPAGLSAKSTTTGVSLTWRPPAGYIQPEWFTVYINTTTSGEYTFVADVTAWTGTTVTLALTPDDFAGTGFVFTAGTRYYFRVYAFATNPFTSEAMASTPASAGATAGPLPPPAPTSLSARSAPAGVTLTWPAPRVAVDGYILYISTSSGGAWTLVRDVTTWVGSHPNYLVTAADFAGTGFTFAPRTRYYFKVHSYIINPFTAEELLSTRAASASVLSGAEVGGPLP
jgi:hypothetical protein